jgi:two-component system, NtrC family, sensor kinase
MNGRRLALRLKLLLLLLAAGLPGGAVLWLLVLSRMRGLAGASALTPGLLPVVGAGVGVLLLLVFVLLDRQLVSPLARIDQVLDQVGGGPPEGAPPLLLEGDLIGRVAPSVSRLERRLREERARIREQFVALEATNTELRDVRADLARNERLASVGRLAAGVAHELGNPVSAVIGYCTILEDRLAAGRDGKEYAGRIAREAARMDRILHDLLDLARPRGPAGEVDLEKVVARAAQLIEEQAVWKGCKLRSQVGATLPHAAGDEHYLVQVLVNLFTNAARAGASTVELIGREEGGAPVVEVLDDGRGLPAEHATRLFEPFFTTAAAGQGSGLGLAICHATMERFGGSISAAPRTPGPGAAFTLRFARAKGPRAEGQAEGPPRPRE